ncbi:hypothetical protein EV426DRAFT_686135 [Tirmania nivea]|nr:hypothetical protein EV426DRAFT_686135 [Tirmania nivea]
MIELFNSREVPIAKDMSSAEEIHGRWPLRPGVFHTGTLPFAVKTTIRMAGIIAVSPTVNGRHIWEPLLGIQTRTVRHAPEYNEEDHKSVRAWQVGESNHVKLKNDFASQTSTLRNELIDLLINNHSFGDFIEGKGQRGCRSASNVNSIHAKVHGNTGGYRLDKQSKTLYSYGNMSSLAGTGFDPIFFLYHCAFDRISAMWEAAHPDQWMDNKDDIEHLLPFRRDGMKLVPFMYLDITLTVGSNTEFITSIINFVSPLETGCANCQRHRDEHHTVTTGTLISPKLRELYKDGKLQDLDLKLLSDKLNFENMLKENLQWNYYALGASRDIILKLLVVES